VWALRIPLPDKPTYRCPPLPVSHKTVGSADLLFRADQNEILLTSLDLVLMAGHLIWSQNVSLGGRL
jgi:hypothetical protein